MNTIHKPAGVELRYNCLGTIVYMSQQCRWKTTITAEHGPVISVMDSNDRWISEFTVEFYNTPEEYVNIHRISE
jgi:hypothetical protein